MAPKCTIVELAA